MRIKVLCIDYITLYGFNYTDLTFADRERPYLFGFQARLYN